MSVAAVDPFAMQTGSGASLGGGDFVRGKDPVTGETIIENMSQEEYMACIVPKRGEYRLLITGFAVPFEHANSFRGQIGISGKVDDRDFVMKTKLDLQIIHKTEGTPGPHVLIWASWPNRLSAQSNLGKVYLNAMQLADIPQGSVSFTDVIGKEFQAMLYPGGDQGQYANCAWDSLFPWTGVIEDDNLWG